MLNKEILVERANQLVGKELTSENLDNIIFAGMPKAHGKNNVRIDGIHYVDNQPSWSKLIVSGTDGLRLSVCMDGDKVICTGVVA